MMARLTRTPLDALFADRDGTLIEDTGYPSDPDAVRLIEDAVDGLRAIQDSGARLFVVSNQSGIGRGLITETQATSVHEAFVDALAERGVTLAGAAYCPHAPSDGCDCRKPSPGLLLRLANEHGVDLARAVMIGDKASDVEAGERAGCAASLRVPTGHGRDAPRATAWSSIVALFVGGAEA